MASTQAKRRAGRRRGRSGARLTGDERLGGAEANPPGGETGGAEEDPPSGWLGTTRRRRRGGCGSCRIPRARAQHARAKGGGGIRGPPLPRSDPPRASSGDGGGIRGEARGGRWRRAPRRGPEGGGATEILLLDSDGGGSTRFAARPRGG